MGKLSFLAGLGVGFVLGARAGRGQYEKLKRQATNVWENPRVAELREQAGEKAGDLAKQAPGTDDDAPTKPLRPTPPQPAPDGPPHDQES
jgi:hypothetical protein